MSEDIFPLVIGFLIISLFLLSIEILNKRRSEQKKSASTPINLKRK
jgi:hypothetical protein